MTTGRLNEIWEGHFRPEIRNQGQSIFAKGMVKVSRLSDTEIQSYIKTSSSSIKVSLKLESLQSECIEADCHCSVAQKERWCKHIWATLLAVASTQSDFLDEKTKIEKKPSSVTKSQTSSHASSQSFSQTAKQEAFKQKRAEFRKQQYQKHKQHQRVQKQSSKQKSSSPATVYPPSIEAAISYFVANGFPMEAPLKAEVVRVAKKKLSRVFHPDVGGDHREILELNRFAEALILFCAEGGI